MLEYVGSFIGERLLSAGYEPDPKGQGLSDTVIAL